MTAAPDNPASFTIGPIRDADWPAVAQAVAESLPASSMARLGPAFTIELLSTIVRQEGAVSLAAHGPEGDLLGIIIGTLDSRACFRRALRARWPRLAAAALRGLRLGRWRWILRRGMSRVFGRGDPDDRAAADPSAECLLVWVSLYGQALRVTDALRRKMEEFFMARGYHGEYVVRTGADNGAANRAARREGARLVRQVAVAGSVINVYHRTNIAAAAADGQPITRTQGIENG